MVDTDRRSVLPQATPVGNSGAEDGVMDASPAIGAAGVLGGPPDYVDLGPTQLAYWKVGRGEPLVLVHGYPLSGRTWRHVAALLADRFTCYVPDLAGAGETRWTEQTDFSFAGQARTLKAWIDRLGLTSYSLMGHDTGATIARRLATLDTARVRRFVLIGTEIPGHRPPWIELFQKIADPRRTGVLQFLMSKRWFRRSSAGFGGCFADKSLIDGDFKTLFLDPAIRSKERASGLTRYLLGIDWAMVDGMASEHARITMPTLLIWGEDDPVFPVARARVIAEQLPDCRGFFTIPNAKLFVQEETPGEVARIAGEFLGAP
jgi:pimeloyl-ACP methyl ester carboxylesterase